MASVTLQGTEFHTNGDLPAVGATAPDFKLVDKDLNDVGHGCGGLGQFLHPLAHRHLARRESDAVVEILPRLSLGTRRSGRLHGGRAHPTEHRREVDADPAAYIDLLADPPG